MDLAVTTLAELRPEVQRFALFMEHVLRENDHKGGWQNMSNDQLLKRLKEEVKELSQAVDALPKPCGCRSVGECMRGMFGPDEDDVAREAVDIANFAMMLADMLGVLSQIKINKPFMAAKPSTAPKATQTRCPKCEAPAGFWCRSERGGIHDERWKAWKAEKRTA